ncbi:hypothetical protein L208DRAFT_1403694 [Tricholoma matsutake]|nr:hypothetical protein L208DRAFT_1403694 [Tricholoma matsutake 945]
MLSSPPLPELSPNPRSFFNQNVEEDDDDGAETASQRSISLSSPAGSPRHTQFGSALNDLSRQHQLTTLRDSDSFSKRSSHPYTVDTDFDDGSSSMFHFNHDKESPSTSATPSLYDDDGRQTHLHLSKEVDLPTYPPSKPTRDDGDRVSISSFASGSSRKARPESLLVTLPNGPLILGIALVDFNHLIGPRIEYSKGDIFESEEVTKILPFLALPDGAHLSAEDYSYFHIVPPGPNPTTVFGISCNQQIAASALLVKSNEVTRSIVQKAVVVLASKPVFGPIRAKLGVVTTALFNQRDFTDASILDDFGTSLEHSLRGQLTESGLYMGTSLRELVHTFRQKTLILVKALMLQKRIMFYGHPVERLCTYQYSLISLLPGLLQTLDDCGSPPLASRAPTLTRPTSLRTSDHKSMMAYLGLPLDVFGKDAFFQPYLPLQQMDMLKETNSWLCGSTNSIVTHQKEIDLLVNTETGAFEFRDPKLERSAGLTAADRKWMDHIVTDVNEGWNEEDPTQSLQFKGSDDYLRVKFEEYVSAALASVRYRDFVAKGEASGVLITGGSGGDANSTEDFNPLWISEFKKTNAYEVWERTTDPLLFDIVEPRHPCDQKPSVVADIGLRLQEGIQDLKLEQQLAPAREAVVRTFSTGSTNFFKAVEGVRGRWAQRSADSTKDGNNGSTMPPSRSNSIAEVPVEVNKSDLGKSSPPMPTTTAGALRPFSLGLRRPSHLNMGTASSPSSSASGPSVSGSSASSPPPPVGAALASWGVGIGSFISTRLARQPSVQEMEKEKEGGDSVSGGVVEGKDVGIKEERMGEEGSVRALQPISEPMTPQQVSTLKINVTSPGGTTPVSGSFEETPPSTASTVGKTRVVTPTPAGTNGTVGRVRAAVLEREKAQVAWSPKDVTSGAHLPSRDEGDKAYATKNLIDSPPRRANSKAVKETMEDPYPQRNDAVHFRDPFASSGSKELHREVDPLQHDSKDDSHRGSIDSTYSNSMKSIGEADAYAGMAL